MDRTADIEDVFEIFEFDGAIDARSGRAPRERIVDADVHGYGAINNRRIDADDVALNDAVRVSMVAFWP